MGRGDSGPGLVEWMRIHRLGLGPLYYAGVLAAVGGAVRVWLVDWSTFSVTVAAACCALAPAAWAVTRLRSRVSRWWVYLVLAASVAWLRLVHSGAMTPTELTVSLLTGTLVLGIGWWVNAARRDKVRVEGELREWDEVAERIRYPHTRWVNHVEQPGRGWTARLSWPTGMYDRDQVIKDAARFERARGLPVNTLRLIPHGREHNFVDAICVIDDPHTEAVEWPGPAKSGDYTAADPTPLGVREDETVASAQRFLPGWGERRILCGGATGSGKSVMLHHLIGEDACREDVAQLHMDLKGGLELTNTWGGVAAWTVDSIPGAIEMCRAIEALIGAHEEIMKEKGWRVWQPSPEYPVVRVSVDEIRELAGSTLGRSAREAREMLDRIIQLATQGRAVGVGLLMAGQLLTVQSTGSTQLRNQFDIRLCFRMNDPGDEEFVLPGDKVRAHQISEDRPGTAYLKVGAKLERMPIRGYFWPDALIEEVARIRAGANSRLHPRAEAAMAAVSPMFKAVLDARDGAEGESGEEPVAPWAEIPEGEDVSLAAVTARHDLRTGRARVATLPLSRDRLSDRDARDAMWSALVAAGRDGATAKQLYTAATRRVTWFHRVINEWCDAGSVRRTRHGTYAAAEDATPPDGDSG